MPTKAEKTEFIDALNTWGDAARIYAAKKRAYRVVHAAAMAKSEAKNAEQRKADADVATIENRAELDEIEILERSAYHLVIFLRGGPLTGEDAS